ncbi:MAG: GIY-YIG nuclease family protein [Pirellulales bacterium]
MVNGLPSEILTAEIINWTGKIIVAPRSMLAELAKREEVKRTGVYVLLGPDPENPARDKVYVGEGDNVCKRLAAHDGDESKEFWVRCAVIISNDQNITKSHGRYIESRLLTLATEADRATIHNGTALPIPQLPEPDIADMEYLISQIQIVLPVRGFSFLQPKPTAQGTVDPGHDVSPIFTYAPAGASARAQEINGEFVVLKGSTARVSGPESWTSYRGLRDQLVLEKKLVPTESPELFVFAEDVAFSSPTAGAVIVNAYNVSGRTGSWRVEGTTRTYHEWYEEKLARVESEPGCQIAG